MTGRNCFLFYHRLRHDDNHDHVQIVISVSKIAMMMVLLSACCDMRVTLRSLMMLHGGRATWSFLLHCSHIAASTRLYLLKILHCSIHYMLSDMTPSLSYTNFPSFQSEMCAFLDMHLHPGYYDHDEDFLLQLW